MILLLRVELIRMVVSEVMYRFLWFSVLCLCVFVGLVAGLDNVPSDTVVVIRDGVNQSMVSEVFGLVDWSLFDGLSVIEFTTDKRSDMWGAYYYIGGKHGVPSSFSKITLYGEVSTEQPLGVVYCVLLHELGHHNHHYVHPILDLSDVEMESYANSFALNVSDEECDWLW